MRLAFSILAMCCLLFVSNSLLANRTVNFFNDSIVLFEKIKQNEREFKRQKSRQLKRVEVNDSRIIYSSDRQRTQITSVIVINPHDETKFFWYINNKLFKITLFRPGKKNNGKRQKKSQGLYFIDNDEVFYKEEKGLSIDATQLIIEANRYRSQGMKILEGS